MNIKTKDKIYAWCGIIQFVTIIIFLVGILVGMYYGYSYYGKRVVGSIGSNYYGYSILLLVIVGIITNTIMKNLYK